MKQQPRWLYLLWKGYLKEPLHFVGILTVVTVVIGAFVGLVGLVILVIQWLGALSEIVQGGIAVTAVIVVISLLVYVSDYEDRFNKEKKKNGEQQ